MKKLVTVLAVAANIFASPASAAPNAQARPVATEQSSDVVIVGSKRGQDPDPYVRAQILRDFQSFH
jgi:hypothetical protein